MKKIIFRLLKQVSLFGVLSLVTLQTFADSLPFDGPMQTIESDISGPIAAGISTIMVVVTCLMLAFGEFGDGFKRFITIVLWLSIALGATSLIQIFT